MIPNYQKIWTLGHKGLQNLFEGPVVIQEKVDGSYFAFGLIDGVLHCRSKSQQLDIDAPEKMFSLAVEYCKSISHKLLPNAVYCCEYLNRPKHNTLAYDRVPLNNLVLFDVELERGTHKWASTEWIWAEAGRLFLEKCPIFSDILSFDWVSCLGGQKIEGFVIKNYSGPELICGKTVSPAFKEVHKGDWRGRNPAPRDIKDELALAYTTPARWEKAIQHLRDAGQLVNGPQDIGPLLKEINKDVLAECEDEIKEKLFKWAWKDLSRRLTRGFPEWYRQKLVKNVEV